MTTQSLLRRVAALLLHAVLACAHAVPVPPDVRGVTVLTYHQISDTKPAGVTVISLARFAEQMQYLADHHYQTLSMDELVAVMSGKMPMPHRPVVLTFDDGWRSQLSTIPVLDRHNMKAAFWVMPGFVGQGEYMNWSELRTVVGNPRFEVQSHSFTHPSSASSNLMTWMQGKPRGKGPKDVRAELVLSRRVLEARLGRPVRYFAWPQGLYNYAMVELAKQSGYQGLLTSDEMPGNSVGDDVFRIRRMAVHGNCGTDAFAAQLQDLSVRFC